MNWQDKWMASKCQCNVGWLLLVLKEVILYYKEPSYLESSPHSLCWQS
jgi:hypothetical protein